eukprot:s256_g4.t1
MGSFKSLLQVLVASSAAYVGTSLVKLRAFSLCPCVLSDAEVQKCSACVSNVTEMFERSDACFACVAFLAVERHLPACLPPCLPWYGQVRPSDTFRGTSSGSSYFAFSMSAKARMGAGDGVD